MESPKRRRSRCHLRCHRRHAPATYLCPGTTGNAASGQCEITGSLTCDGNRTETVDLADAAALAVMPSGKIAVAGRPGDKGSGADQWWQHLPPHARPSQRLLQLCDEREPQRSTRQGCSASAWTPSPASVSPLTAVSEPPVAVLRLPGHCASPMDGAFSQIESIA